MRELAKRAKKILDGKLIQSIETTSEGVKNLFKINIPQIE